MSNHNLLNQTFINERCCLPCAETAMRKLNAARLSRQMHSQHHHHNHIGHDCRCDSSSVLTSDVDSTTFVDSDDDDDYQTHEDDYEDLDDEFDRLTQISGTTEDTSVSKAAENREKRRKRMLLQAKFQQQQLHHQHQQGFDNGMNKMCNGASNGKSKSKNPYAKLNRSLSRTSSTSSITDSTMSLNIITVTLHLTSVNFLGISIVGQSYKNGDGGIYVGSIMSGGAVAADGRIDPGDMILQVNDMNFENLSNDKAVEVLREAVSKPGPIKLVIAKCSFPQNNGAMNSMSGNSTVGGLTSADILAIKKDEPVRPIDPRAWVEHTKIAQGYSEPGMSFHVQVTRFIQKKQSCTTNWQTFHFRIPTATRIRKHSQLNGEHCERSELQFHSVNDRNGYVVYCTCNGSSRLRS
jgi:hypothetical protein